MSELGEVQILGPLAVRDGRDDLLVVGGGRERALLVRLALAGGRLVAVDGLIDDLFGESPPATARNALQVYVSHLRKQLGAGAIRSTDGGYGLVPPANGIDADRFAQLVATGIGLRRTGAEDSAVEVLEDALRLWRGQPLADLSDYGFVRTAAIGLTELHASALEELAEAQLAGGRHGEVVTRLMPLLAEHPFRERLRAALMTALYRSRDRSGALAVYRDGRRILQQELGLDPGPALKALHVAILSDDPALVTEAPRARGALDAIPPPAPATPLLGRANALATLSAMVDRRDVRLVTVLGPGGAGKSRLAVELALHPPRRYASATLWTSLASLADTERALPAIAAALRLHASELDVAQISAALNGGDVLLVLDNAEHLLPGLADMASALLSACPELTVVVTSRSALRLDAEHRFLLEPLPVPDSDGDLDDIVANPAVQLFSRRAKQAHPAFALTATVAPDVARICRRLDGLPLALELAAARANLLDPGAMLIRLQSRLSLLTSAPQRSSVQHRSLRAALDWSYQLLPPPAREVFGELAVFRGGFTVESAEAVVRVTPTGTGSAENAAAPTTADAIQELLDASLVIRDPDGRMSMLETSLEYATERLSGSGHADRVPAAHAAYFGAQVRLRSAHIPPRPTTAAEVDWFTREQENVRAATRWAAAHDRDLLVDLATGSAGYWQDTGHWADFEPVLERAARHAAGVRGFDAEYRLAVWLLDRGRVGDASDHIERALAHLAGSEDPARLAVGLAYRALLARITGDSGHAIDLGEAALRAATSTDDLDARAVTFAAAADAVGFQDPARHRRLLAQALEQAVRADNEHVVLTVLNNLAELALAAGDQEEALHWCRETIRREMPAKSLNRGYILDIMAGALLLKGDLARARTALREALRLALSSSELLLDEGLLFSAALAAAGGDLAAAAMVLGGRHATLQGQDLELQGSNALIHDRFLADLPSRLGPGAYAAYRAQGEALTRQQLIDWLLHDQAPQILLGRLADTFSAS